MRERGRSRSSNSNLWVCNVGGSVGAGKELGQIPCFHSLTYSCPPVHSPPPSLAHDSPPAFVRSLYTLSYNRKCSHNPDLLHAVMPQGQKTSDEICHIVSCMLAAQVDIEAIMAFTGLSKRQIQQIKATIKATREPVRQATRLVTRGRPRTLELDDVEVKTPSSLYFFRS